MHAVSKFSINSAEGSSYLHLCLEPTQIMSLDTSRRKSTSAALIALKFTA